MIIMGLFMDFFTVLKLRHSEKKKNKEKKVTSYYESESDFIERCEQEKSPDQVLYETELFMTAIENGDSETAILMKTADTHLMRCIAKAQLDAKYGEFENVKKTRRKGVY